jgi:hypothetical protein
MSSPFAPTPLNRQPTRLDGWVTVPEGPPLSVAPQATSSSSSSANVATASQLFSMLALPAGFGGSRRRRQAKGKKGPPLARDGQVVAVSFSQDGTARPYPIFSRLTQSIQVTLEAVFPAYHTTSNTVPTFKGISVALTSFTSSGYTSLFDDYKFEQIEAWLEPDYNVGGVINGGPWASVVDLDDANAPAAFDTVTNRQGALVSGVTSGHYHRWKPHMAVAAYSGAFTSYANEPAGWIDCASPSVQHFGLKAAFPVTSSGAYTYSLTLRAVVTLRDPAV